MTELDMAQKWHAAKAIASRKLQEWMVADWDRRQGTQEYFDHVVTAAWVLSQTADWMTEEELIAAWPKKGPAPHIWVLENVERVLAYAKIAETDAEMGWTKFRWAELPVSVLSAVSDFRFSQSYSGQQDEFDLFRSVAVSDLFVPFPNGFGLRGDAFLWGKLSAFFWTSGLDATTDIERTIKEGFSHLTGEDFDRARDPFFNDGLAHGGMSSGHVSMAWWRDIGLPLLKERFSVIRSALPISFLSPAPTSD